MDIHNIVLLGEAGSGKTEIAANIAILLAEKDEKPVYLIDMDQTKCLFRARDFSSLLEKRQVHMAENQELWDSPPGAYGGQRPVKGRRGPVCI
ncbi:ATP-binding protein [Enterocloster aldenensis]|uniref:ATP-binding protein n=1 Tax=Enterocloster aldenensis TaxID=358742 RepID=UPI0025A45346|nr:ATP-binding protein [Enterocloster aldenensis]